MRPPQYIALGIIAAAIAGSAYLAPRTPRKSENLDLFGTEMRMKERRVDIETDINRAKYYLGYCKGEDEKSKYDGVCKLLRQRNALEETKRSAHVWKFPDLEQQADAVERKIDEHIIDDHFEPYLQNLKKQ